MASDRPDVGDGIEPVMFPRPICDRCGLQVLTKVPPWRYRRMEECVRCAVCHCPRCGDAGGDPDPCMRRRHHASDHVSLSGDRWPLGGDKMGVLQ